MNKMNKYDVMWKCPSCDRMIPDSLYMVAKMHGVNERYKDRNDTIMNGKYINIKDNV
jgi:hypothetical protein